MACEWSDPLLNYNSVPKGRNAASNVDKMFE